jgi:UDP-glucose 4-epimerase
MSVLVTGGAGYIGSHMTYGLIDRGEDVVVLDNLSTGIRGLVGERANFVQGEVADAPLLRRTILTSRSTRLSTLPARPWFPNRCGALAILLRRGLR